MKIYTIGTEVSQTYGHGDCGSQTMIQREGFYGSGDFPPCFLTRKFAENYLAEKKTLFGRIVELELIVPEIPN